MPSIFFELPFEMAHTYVKVKLQNKVLKLRPEMVTVANLAMIFKLEVNQGIYIHSEEEGEIILPSDSGAFTVEEYGKTYVVNGEPVSSSTSAEAISSTSLFRIRREPTPTHRLASYILTGQSLRLKSLRGQDGRNLHSCRNSVLWPRV